MNIYGKDNENRQKAPAPIFSRIASEVIVNTLRPVSYAAAYNLKNQAEVMFPEALPTPTAPQPTAVEAPQSIITKIEDMAVSSEDMARQLVANAFPDRDVEMEQAA